MSDQNHAATLDSSATDRSPEEPMTPSPLEGLSQRAQWGGEQPISYLMEKALAHPELVSLAAGFVDQQTLPVEETAQAVEALLSDPDYARQALQYGTTPGYTPLREEVLRRLLLSDGQTAENAGVSVDQVVLTAGSNQLLHLVSDTLFDPGDIVLCTAPSYLVYLGTAANIGARSLGVEMDEDGLIPDALDDQLERLHRADLLHRVKAIYVVTYFDNPTGITLAESRRPQIVEIARRWSTKGRILVIEDMAYRQLRYHGDDLPSLRSYDETGDTVIVAQTFSKSFSPGIRIGYGVLPRNLVLPVCDQKGNIDFGSPNFSQHLMYKVLTMGLFDRHVERLRASYSAKLDAMLESADEYLGDLPDVQWTRPDGGLYVWLRLPESIDTGPDGRLFDLAMEEGTFYVPGQYCYPAEGLATPRNMIRLSFGVQSCEGIRRGMQMLGRAIHRVLDEE